jgi:tetratricopeptide (TPR) repeat protein
MRVASTQLNRGRPESALARLDQLTELRPDDPEVKFRRGLALRGLRQVPEAVSDLEFAADRLPGRADVLYELAVARELAEQPEAALDAAEQAVQIAPNFAAAQEMVDRLRR